MGSASGWLCVSQDLGEKFLVRPLFLSVITILCLLTNKQLQSENSICTPGIFYELNVSHIVTVFQIYVDVRKNKM